MDFKMLTDLSNLPKKIEFNFEELKTDLVPKLDYYKNLVVSEDGIKEAKADKANLNKLAKAIDDKRKEVKTQCLEPYMLLERQCKEIIDMIKEPILLIDNQIKVFENLEEENKYKAIEKFFNENVMDLKDLIKLDMILNAKWKNKGTKLIEITQEIIESIEKIRVDLQTIEKLNTEKESILKDFYLKNGFDIGKTLAEKIRLDEQEQKLIELKAKQEEERLKNEEYRKQREEQQSMQAEQNLQAQKEREEALNQQEQAQQQEQKQEEQQVVSVPELKKRYRVKFCVTIEGTKAEIMAKVAEIEKMNLIIERV